MNWRVRICQFLFDHHWTGDEVEDWLNSRRVDTMGGRTPYEILASGDGERLWREMVLPDEEPAGGKDFDTGESEGRMP